MTSSGNAALLRVLQARPATYTPRLAHIVVAALLSVALALRLYHLDAQSLWLDEGGTWAEVTGRTGKGWWMLVAELWSADAAYPLYHLLLKCWVSLAGDSEWALRFPSALAGAGTVGALYGAATEGSGEAKFLSSFPYSLFPPTLAAMSPFALWYAQDAKVYSLLLLVTALLLWALLRAVRCGGRAWLLVVALVVVSVLVHRLALLSLAGVALAVALTMNDQGRTTKDEGRTTKDERSSRPHPFIPSPVRPLIRWGMLALAVGGGMAGIYGVVRALGDTTAGASGHVAAGPLLGLWLTLAHFSVDRGNINGFLGLPLFVWVLPCFALTCWGLTLLFRDALRGQRTARVVLCMFAVPLLLLAVALFITPIYEARYAAVAFPAWVLVLAYPFADDRQLTTDDRRRKRFITGGRWLVVGSLLIVNGAVLFQPQHGQFSGAPVKEQWRAAVTDVAHRVHPDDLLIVHPYYVKPLWDYYAPRVTADRLPEPVIFPIFGEGDRGNLANPTNAQLREFVRKRYDPFFDEQAKGKKRMLLLIAPDHARTVDPPPQPHDRYGWLGLRFVYPQKTWPCGGTGDAYIGVEVMCQSLPETFNQFNRGMVPQPAIRLDATFGGEIKLLGYSVTPFDGILQGGGTLPVTLYWQSVKNPTQPYTMFLHLCRDCDLPPLASNDSAPLNGYDPAGNTTTWRGYPVHDGRTLALPTGLAPGRYTLILGVYPAGQPGEGQRLPVVSNGQALPHNRLVLGEVTVSAR